MSVVDAPIEADIDAEARRLLARIDQAGLEARLIGGMAIRLLTGERLHPAFVRPIQDLDFVVARRHKRELDALVRASGYLPELEFNALNGARRLLYRDPRHGRQIDIFVETFAMCHTLPLAERLLAHPHTLPATDVLMTKLQIVDLNAKDRGDLYALLHGAAIELDRIVALSADDWGLQHTFELNLERLRVGLGSVPPEIRDAVVQRIDAIEAAMEAAPKSRKWKLRAKVGERKRWYDEPEEVDREH